MMGHQQKYIPVERKMLIFKIVCIYYIICNGWNLYFMYYEIPVPWVHHNLCNGMECSKHSMVKTPYLFSTCNMDAPETYSF